MKRKVIFSLFLFYLLISCVPYQQQINDEINKKIASSYKGLILNDPELYKSRIALESQSKNVRYESILDGSISRTPGEPVMEIYGDFLFFYVQHEGGKDPSYQLIWDGTFEIDKKGKYHVNFIFDYHINSRNRSLYHKYLGFDLSSIKDQTTSEIMLHFYGVRESIKYNY